MMLFRKYFATLSRFEHAEATRSALQGFDNAVEGLCAIVVSVLWLACSPFLAAVALAFHGMFDRWLFNLSR